MSDEIKGFPEIVNEAKETERLTAKKQRSLQRAFVIGILFLVISLVSDLLNYSELGAWQILAESSGDFLSLLVLIISFMRFRRSQPEQSFRLIPIAILLTYTTGDLFLSGDTAYNLVSGLLLLAVGYLIFEPRNKRIWLTAAIIHSFVVLLLSLVNIFPQIRLEQAGTQIAITAGVSTLLIWQFVRRFEIRSIRTRLLLLLIAIGLIPTFIISAASLVIDFQRDTNQAEALVQSIAEIKTQQITDWEQRIKSDLNTLDLSPVLVNYTRVLTQYSLEDETLEQTKAFVRETLDNLSTNTQRYQRLSIISPEGIILVSTDPVLEGKNVQNDPDFLFALDGYHFSNPVVNTEDDTVGAEVYYQIQETNGNLLAIALAQPSFAPLTQLVQTGNQQLGETGEAFLVSSSNQLLTSLQQTKDYQPGSYTVGAEAIEAAGTDVRSYDTQILRYSNYNGKAVIGSYTWIPEIKSSLIIEQSETEAFQSLRLNVIINTIIGLLTLTATVVVAVNVARSFSAPVGILISSARQVSRGEVEQIDPIDRQDEIGELSATLSAMTSQLTATTINLEKTVAERTAILERRAKYLETNSIISRAVTNIYDINVLLNTITQLISENFGFYHVGIFLNDEHNEYAILHAANSEGGWKMLAREHKLKVGEQGIVGYVTESGEARIQQQVSGEDSVYFSNPDLPLTRSEMALPLKVGNNIFGALDVQSQEESAFTQEDITVLQGLADSVSVAIQNTRLIQQLQENLETERRLFGEITKETWQSMLSRKNVGMSIRSDQAGTQMISSPSTKTGEQAMQQGKTVVGVVDEATHAYPLALPVTVRGGVTIGVVETQKSVKDGVWTKDEISILENVCSELGLALDNARLFEETQLRAQRDRIAADLSTKIWASSDVENILQTAVRELGSALQASHGSIRLTLPEEKPVTGEPEPVTDGANQS